MEIFRLSEKVFFLSHKLMMTLSTKKIELMHHQQQPLKNISVKEKLLSHQRYILLFRSFVKSFLVAQICLKEALFLYIFMQSRFVNRTNKSKILLWFLRFFQYGLNFCKRVKLKKKVHCSTSLVKYLSIPLCDGDDNENGKKRERKCSVSFDMCRQSNRNGNT